MSVVSVHDRQHNFLEVFNSHNRLQSLELLKRFRLSHDIETLLPGRFLLLHVAVIRLACELVNLVGELILHV